ncbi:hypothetical protein H1R20_g743, partial [Candolleomyces eurysporus]
MGARQILTIHCAALVMNSTDEKPAGVIGVATSGIQDVSALLPLLGTEQCAALATSALERGWLYAAATPMSIFGSLGIVKAGFLVLWTSIDHQWFPGPTLLRNAGFVAEGTGALLTCRDKGNRKNLYKAEDKLQKILANKHIRSVTVKPWSKDIILWNVRMICATALLGSLGLLPYVFLITQTLPDRSFQSTWIYPILRIAGCSMVVITIQLIFQLRLLDELYCRIRFMATDRYMTRNLMPIPVFWDPGKRSKNVLKKLLDETFSDPHIENGDCVKAGIGTWSSFSFLSEDKSQTASGGPTRPIIDPAIPLCLACQFFLLSGVVLAVVGYVGCFSIVQASPRTDSKGPVLWLIAEDDPKSPIVLEKVAGEIEDGGDPASSSLHAVGWELNSVTADDMHALIVGIDEFKSPSFPDLQSCVSDAMEMKKYLESTLLVPHDQIVLLRNADATKERIVEELEGLSQRASVEPNAPIIIYFATHSFMRATSNDITTYLVPHGADATPDPYLDQERQAVRKSYLSYDTIQALLRRIADEKTKNVTLIMDTCHAGSLGTRYKGYNITRTPAPVPPHQIPREPHDFEVFGITRRGTGVSSAPQKVDILTPHSSHVVLAGTSAWGQAFELPHAGGLFTRAVIKALTEATLEDFQQTTYKKLIENTNRIMGEEWERALEKVKNQPGVGSLFSSSALDERFRQKAECTNSHENREVFGGLLSRRITDKTIRPVITVKYSDS